MGPYQSTSQTPPHTNPRPRRWYENGWGEWLFPGSIAWEAAGCGYLAFLAWLYLWFMTTWSFRTGAIMPRMEPGLVFAILSLWLGMRFHALRKKNPHLRGLGRVRGGIFFSSMFLGLFPFLTEKIWQIF